MNYAQVRQALFDIVQQTVAADLIRASAGNLSMRTADGHLAITPTSIPYDQLAPGEIAIVDLDGNHIDGPCTASSETPMHTAIMRNLPNVGAMCHTHSHYAMTFAVVGREIPLINTEALMCGAPIPVAPWASPGSGAGGEVTVKLLRSRPELKVVLLRSHGVVAVGEDIHQAFGHAYNAEVAAQVYYQGLQIGEPIIITPEQKQEIYEIYGMAGV
ncbi:MAG: class II aldolase/adducin family protein [Chloroflexota bacterium]